MKDSVGRSENFRPSRLVLSLHCGSQDSAAEAVEGEISLGRASA